MISEFFHELNSSKYFTCPLGKLRTEFTGPIAKSTSPGLSDTTFFAHCWGIDVSPVKCSLWWGARRAGFIICRLALWQSLQHLRVQLHLIMMSWEKKNDSMFCCSHHRKSYWNSLVNNNNNVILYLDWSKLLRWSSRKVFKVVPW